MSQNFQKIRKAIETVGLDVFRNRNCEAQSHRNSILIIKRLLIAVLLFLSPVSAVNGQAQNESDNSVLLLYSSSDNAYQKVIDKMVEQTSSALESRRLRYEVFAIRKNSQQAALWLKSRPEGIVIAFGNEAYSITKREVSAERIIVTGVPLVDSERDIPAGLDLIPDARPALETLRRLSPGINRVVIVERIGVDKAYIKRARNEANRQGIELVVHYAKNSKEEASLYWNILKFGNSHSDALWIISAYGRLDHETIWRKLIEKAWSKRFFIFSNTLEHASLGAIFALYPSPESIGEHLADIASRRVRGEAVGVENITSVNTALNLRHARHQGLRLSDQIVNGFSAVFGSERR